MTNYWFIALVVLTIVHQAYGECGPVMKCYDHVVNGKVNDQIKVELSGYHTYLRLSQIFDHQANHYPKVTKYLRDKATEKLTHAERFVEHQNQRGGTVEMEMMEPYKEGGCKVVEDVTAAVKCAMELEAYVTAELTQLHNDVSAITINHKCGKRIKDIKTDDLRRTQPLLVSCTPNSEGSSDNVTTSNPDAICICNSICSVNYVELADMIGNEFLGQQVEDTKVIANYYQSLKKLQAANGEQGLGEFLFDKHVKL